MEPTLQLPSTMSQNGNGNQPININVQTGTPDYIDYSMDPPLDPMNDPQSTPPAMSQVIASATGGGAAAVTAYFFNEDIYNATPTNNGSGANSVVNTYGDGWTGLGYNALGKSINGARGVLTFGFTLVFIVTSSSLQDQAGIAAASPNYLVSNLVGNRQRPYGMPLNAGTRNTQFQDGTMTVKIIVYFTCLSQLSYNVPLGDTSTLTVMTRPFTY